MIRGICEDETHLAAKMRLKLHVDICSVFDVIIAVNDLLALAADIHVSSCFPRYVSCYPEHPRYETLSTNHGDISSFVLALSAHSSYYPDELTTQTNKVRMH